MSFPFNSAIAFVAPESSISTKPNPRERPVSRSVITRADSTWPTPAKTLSSSLSVTLPGKVAYV